MQNCGERSADRGCLEILRAIVRTFGLVICNPTEEANPYSIFLFFLAHLFVSASSATSDAHLGMLHAAWVASCSATPGGHELPTRWGQHVHKRACEHYMEPAGHRHVVHMKEAEVEVAAPRAHDVCTCLA